MKATTTLKKFLLAWKNQNPELMKKYTQLSYLDMKKNQKIDLYQDCDKIEFSNIVEIRNTGVLADIKCKIDGEMIQIRLIKEKAPYKPSIDGKWGVNPNSIRSV